MGKSASKAKAAIDEGREEEFAAELRGDDGVIRLPYERAPPKPVDLNALLEKYPEGEDEESAGHKESLRGESEREAGSDAHDEFSPEGAYSTGSSGVGPCMDFKEKRPLRETIRGEEETGIAGPDAEGMEVGSFSGGMAVSPGHSLQQRERRDVGGKTPRETLRAEEETGITGPDAEGMEVGSFSGGMAVAPGHSLQRRDAEGKTPRETLRAEEETGITGPGSEGIEEGSFSSDMALVAGHSLQQKDIKMMKGSKEKENAEKDSKDKRALKEETVLTSVSTTNKPEQGKKTNKGDDKLESDGKNNDNKKEVDPSDVSPVVVASHGMKDEDKHKDESQEESEKDEITGTKRVKGDGEHDKANRDGKDDADRSIREDVPDVVKDGESRQSSVTLSDIPELEDDIPSDASLSPRAAHRSSIPDDVKDKIDSAKDEGKEKDSKEKDEERMEAVDLSAEGDQGNEERMEAVDLSTEGDQGNEERMEAVDLSAEGDQGNEERMEAVDLSAEGEAGTEDTEETDASKEPIMVNHFKEFLNMFRLGGRSKSQTSTDSVGGSVDLEDGEEKDKASEKEGENDTENKNVKSTDNAVAAMVGLHAHGGEVYDQLAEGDTQALSSLSARVKMLNQSQDNAENELAPGGVGPEQGLLSAENVGYETAVMGSGPEHGLESGPSQGMGAQGGMKLPAGAATGGGGGKGQDNSQGETTMVDAGAGIRDDCLSEQVSVPISSLKSSNLKEVEKQNDAGNQEDKSTGAPAGRGKGQDNKTDKTTGIDAEGILSEDFVSQPWFKPEDQANLEKKASEAQAKKGIKGDTTTTKAGIAKKGIAGKGLTKQKSKESQDTAKGGLSKQDSTEDKKTLRKSPSVGSKAGKESATGKSTADKSKSEGSSDKKTKPNTTNVEDGKEESPNAEGKKGQDNKIGETAGVNADGSLSEEFVSAPWFKSDDDKKATATQAKKGTKSDTKTTKVSAAKYGSAKKGLTSQKSKEGQDTAKGGLSKQDSTQDKKSLIKSPSVGGKAGKVSETGKTTADKSKPEGSPDKKNKPNAARVGDEKEGDPGKSSDAEGKKGQDNKIGETAGVNADGTLSEEFVSAPWFKSDDDKKATAAQAKKGTKSDTKTTKVSAAKYGSAKKGLTSQKSKEGQDTAKGGLSKQDSTQDKKTLNKSPSVGGKAGKESGTGKTTADKSKSEGSPDKKNKLNTASVEDGKEESPNAEGKKGQDNKVGETAGVNADGSLSEEFVSQPWFNGASSASSQAKPGEKEKGKTLKKSNSQEEKAGAKKLQRGSSKEGKEVGGVGVGKEASDEKVKKAKTNKLGSAPSIDHPEETLIAPNKQPVSGAGAGKEDTGDKELKGTGKHVERAPSVEHVEEYLPAPSTRALKLGKFGKMTPVEDEDDPSTSDDLSDKSKKDGSKGEEGGSKDPNGGKGSGQQGLSEEDEGVPPSPSDVSSQPRESISSIDDPASESYRKAQDTENKTSDDSANCLSDDTSLDSGVLLESPESPRDKDFEDRNQDGKDKIKKLVDQEQTEPQEEKISATVLLENVQGQKARLISSDSLEGDQSIIEEGRWSQEVSLDSQSTLADDSLSREISFDDPDNTMGGSFDQEDGTSEVSLTGASELNLDDLGIMYDDWGAPSGPERSLESRQDDRGIMMSDDEDDYEEEEEESNDEVFYNEEKGEQAGRRRRLTKQGSKDSTSSREGSLSSSSSNAKRRSKVRFSRNITPAWRGLKKLSAECVPDSEGLEGRLGEASIKMTKLLQEAEAAHRADSPDVDGTQAKVTLQAYGLKIGDKVMVGGVKTGVLRFCGPTEFASGIWAGIELDEAAGKNDGSVGGVSYFKCSPKHGIFAPVSKISRPGILVNRGGSTPRRAVNYGHVDTSKVTAKVDTGLHRARSARSAGGHSAGEDGLLEPGERVLVAGQRRGVIKFSGETDFAPGLWYGIELDRPVGKNDGSVNGKRYFTCKPKYGVFAPPSRIQKLSDLPDAGECLEAVAERQKRLTSGAGSGSQPTLSTTSSTTKAKQGPARQSGLLEPSHIPTPIRRSAPKSSGSAGGLRRPLSLPTSGGEFRLQEGTSVFCNNELGVIRFMGAVEFAEGIWLGVELRTSKGKNDGMVNGTRYFTCRPNHGVLVRPSKVTVRGINGAKLMGNLETGGDPDKKDSSY